MIRANNWYTTFQGFTIIQKKGSYIASSYCYNQISNTDINKLKREINMNKEKYFK